MADSSSRDMDGDGMARFEDVPFRTRIRENPRPAMKWGAVMAFLVIIELGTLAPLLVGILDSLVMGVTGILDVVFGTISSGLASTVVDIQMGISSFLGQVSSALDVSTLLSNRELLPNQGYKLGPNGPWEGTFLGLEPAVAWAIRFTLIVAYSLFTLFWIYRGWKVYRRHYRQATWTPTDDMVRRLQGHRWAQFGIIVIALFLTMAIFGPALGPTTVEQNIVETYGHEIKYYDAEEDAVKEIKVGTANFNSKSKGQGDQNVAPMSYDNYGRFHPFGTTPNGEDLFTFLMGGARISLIVSGLAIGIASFIAAAFSMLSAYYRGAVDLTILTTADGVLSVPRLLLLIMVSAVFATHWLGQVLDGGLLLALIFGFTTWPFLWRSVRGPALQVAQEEWIDAAKSFGQQPRVIMRKHMFPYIVGYLLIYASMATGGIIISLSALSFLGNGLGISAPTPAWGRAVNMGQTYVGGQSGHISLISGLMIVVLVTGLNAFGDGIRDAVDPESEGAEGEEAAAGGGA